MSAAFNRPAELEKILCDASERGKKYRERGGGFQTGISKIQYDTVSHIFLIVSFPARYPKRSYGEDGVLIPAAPYIPYGATISGYKHISSQEALDAFRHGMQPADHETHVALEKLLPVIQRAKSFVVRKLQRLFVSFRVPVAITLVEASGSPSSFSSVTRTSL